MVELFHFAESLSLFVNKQRNPIQVQGKKKKNPPLELVLLNVSSSSFLKPQQNAEFPFQLLHYVNMKGKVIWFCIWRIIMFFKKGPGAFHLWMIIVGDLWGWGVAFGKLFFFQVTLIYIYFKQHFHNQIKIIKTSLCVYLSLLWSSDYKWPHLQAQVNVPPGSLLWAIQGHPPT